ncbi:hypothetical protein Y032_0694g1591 [Ancylostoma ceylanicum]|uniref:Uncharacterized protein n=1 Tax=Ancylostoma ceylanicum TaxID=53326 RepID=A0A016WHM6_9BILA|nr:hypothetical protein Y032_0694g1591 [Ancylostoma ceylanicum]
MAAQAILAKISYHIDAEKAPAHPYVPYDGCTDYYHTQKAPRTLRRMPDNLGTIIRDSYIVRLTTAIQIVGGRPFPEVPDDSRDAYIYELLTVAQDAFDGATGEAIPQIRAAIIRYDTCADTYGCTCTPCTEEHISFTWKEHLQEQHGAELEFPETPMLQFGMGKEERFLTMEQIWLQLPRKVQRDSGPSIKPQPEMGTWTPRLSKFWPVKDLGSDRAATSVNDDDFSSTPVLLG